MTIHARSIALLVRLQRAVGNCRVCGCSRRKWTAVDVLRKLLLLISRLGRPLSHHQLVICPHRTSEFCLKARVRCHGALMDWHLRKSNNLHWFGVGAKIVRVNTRGSVRWNQSLILCRIVKGELVGRIRICVFWNIRIVFECRPDPLRGDAESYGRYADQPIQRWPPRTFLKRGSALSP